LFAWALSEGLSGKADTNRDNRLETTELYSFLAASMGPLAGTIQQKQSPQLFLPDNRPPRLSADAKKAIQGLAVSVRQNEVDVGAARSLYDTAQAAAGKEIEPKLLFGLVLLRSRQKADAAKNAAKHFESVKMDQPGLPLPSAALAWLRFESGKYPAGTEELLELVSKIKARGSQEAGAGELQAIAQWMGQLREFADSVDEKHSTPAQTLAKLDAAVGDLGEAALKVYEQGRDETRATLKQIEAETESADEAAKARLRIKRRQIGSYSQFPFDAAVESVLANLDR
jgi:3-methyladenine DNA glycosylase Tag